MCMGAQQAAWRWEMFVVARCVCVCVRVLVQTDVLRLFHSLFLGADYANVTAAMTLPF